MRTRQEELEEAVAAEKTKNHTADEELVRLVNLRDATVKELTTKQQSADNLRSEQDQCLLDLAAISEERRNLGDSITKFKEDINQIKAK